MKWRPADKYFLELPRLKEVRNVSWAAECMECWLIKNVSDGDIKRYSKTSYIISKPDTCVIKQYNVSDFLVLLARHRFLVRKCRSRWSCLNRKEQNVTRKDSCWDLKQRLSWGQLVLGIVAGCLNSIVVVNILFSKSLRKNVSLILVSNLALGDTLSCMYSIITASIVVSNRYEDLHHFYDRACSTIGSLFVLGQVTSAFTSLALTIERYLCIVFSMKPDIRLTPRLASLTIAFNWCFAVCTMSVAIYFDLYFKTHFCLPIGFSKLYSPTVLSYTLFFVISLVTFYLLTIPLYVHIYIVVKRSSQQMGVKRESALAKRIGILVGNNLVLFFTPVLTMSLWSSVLNSGVEVPIYSNSVIQQWVPIYCLSINVCLNPFLHAFRNDKFKNALKNNLSSTGNTNHVAPAAR